MSLDDLSGVMLDVGELVLVPIALTRLRCEQSVHTSRVGDELGGRLTEISWSTRKTKAFGPHNRTLNRNSARCRLPVGSR